ncbi:MAG: response regulator [Spirochaetes bacterium]|nr:response regulator [Spirochaetota bacterium]
MKKIIFIDDEENLLTSLKRSLRNLTEDWIPFFETDPVKAFELIEKEMPDVIVTDYKMPGMNGIELLEKSRKLNPSVKTILLSGQSENEVFEKAKKVTDNYITKPCDFDELKKTILSLF